jgi:hypothetical protein
VSFRCDAMIEQYDNRENYCRQLGQCILFKYCRSVNAKLPCSAILDCWYHRLPIQQFIATHFSREELGKIFASPRDKVLTMLQMAAKVSGETPDLTAR